MTSRDKIDGVLIEADENGFHLLLSGEFREYNFLLPGTVAEELMRAVRREIEPWAAEGARYARARAIGEELYETDLQTEAVNAALGYDPDDPKHPTYHDRLSEVWDSREEK